MPAWPAAIIVNAAEIAALRWPDDPSAHAYDAARIAADTRTRLIDLGRPPIAETVFSHRSQLDLVRQASQAGYAVALHVLMVPEDLSVARVAYRAAAGSHDVPVDKIRQRHRRLSSIVAAAVPLADSATFWENSRQEDPCIVGLFSEGLAVGYPDWPSWAPDVLVDRRPSRR